MKNSTENRWHCTLDETRIRVDVASHADVLRAGSSRVPGLRDEPKERLRGRLV